jgi:four helix bundle protein
MAESGRVEEEQTRFEELKFYQIAQLLVQAAYEVAKKLPDYEKYNMASQLRRAALSTTLNVAEGYGRYHYPDKLRFFYYARGSLYETLSAFVSAHSVKYIDDQQLAWVRRHCDEAAAALNGYINYIRKHKQGAATYGEKYVREPAVLSDYEFADTYEPSQFPTPEFPNSLSTDTGEET